MNILVCGGRNFGNIEQGERGTLKEQEYLFIQGTLGQLSMDWPKTPEDKYGNWLPNVRIITGGAKGVDSAAIDWAVVNWCEFKEYLADWRKHGKAAGPIRNQQMLDEEKIDLVVAFPGGSGTADMVRRARKAGIPVKEIE